MLISAHVRRDTDQVCGKLLRVNIKCQAG
jgi:hypothetical protein